MLGSNDEYTLYITSSWFAYLSEGREHPKHHHTNSIVSGVYYLSTTDGDSIEFHNYINAEAHNMTLSNIINEYNYPSCKVPVQDSALVIFPSTVPHSVLPVPSRCKSDLRVSLAFNTFIKGSVGDSTSANLLTI